MGAFSFLVSIPLMSGLFKRIYGARGAQHSKQILGLNFPNPVGLAAGFDKDGRYIKALSCLGFGFIEVGTVTPKPQGGNPKPRLFRLIDSQALINRMGFNNQGCDRLVERLKALGKRDVIIGANIGKNKVTPNEQAVDDYLYCFRKLHPYVDYFVINVSSPNTPGLRELQNREPLTRLLQAVQSENRALETPRPILLKIAPDLTVEQIEEIVEIVDAAGIAGLVATNTTLERGGLSEDPAQVEEIGAGGVSGKPVRKMATSVIEEITRHNKNDFPLIGVGGIFDGKDAAEKLKAGADLVQVYTGFIYRGPGIVKSILKGL